MAPAEDECCVSYSKAKHLLPFCVMDVHVVCLFVWHRMYTTVNHFYGGF